MTKAKKPRKRAWWKFWQAPEAKAPKAIAYDRTAVPMGVVSPGVVDPSRKSQD